MYAQQPSDARRQGDILRGRGLSAPELQVTLLREMLSGAGGDGSYTLQMKSEVKTELYVVLSQCCDLDDARLLLAPLIPASKMIRWDQLNSDEQDAFRSNNVGVPATDDAAGGVPGTTPDGTRMAPMSLVLPGYFFWLS